MADEMLINGLIKFCDAKSKNMELKAEPQVYVEIKCALEEFKALKDGSIPIIHGKAELELYGKEIRNKAIDEFADKLIIMMPGHRQDIEQIAEQMKGGGNDVETN